MKQLWIKGLILGVGIIIAWIIGTWIQQKVRIETSTMYWADSNHKAYIFMIGWR